MSGAAGEWESMLVPVQQFPVNEEQTAALRAFLGAFSAAVLSDPEQKHEVLLQTWKLSPQTGSGVLNEHLKDWTPELGLGVWPNRAAPGGWTERTFVDAVAAQFRHAEPELPSHRLLRLAGRPAARLEAAERMRGFGATVEVFSREAYPVLEKRAREVYLPRITERRFQRETFYLPLLDREGLRAAGTPARLAEWMCGVEVYVRESAEDGGVLIVSRLPLAPLMEQVQRKLRLGGRAQNG